MYMPCSGLTLMLQSLLNFLASTKKASLIYKALCYSDAFVWIVSIEPLPTLSPFSPIVFILSPGADPAGELGKLADVKGYGGNRFKFLAMGQGQEKVCHLGTLVFN